MQKTALYTIMVDEVLLRKLKYVAECDSRTMVEEFELMIREWVRAFEEVDGEIALKE